MSELEDRYDIAQVIIRYATSVDQRDFTRYGSCFTHDVFVSGFGSKDVSGRENWVDFVRSALEVYLGTHHQITNQEVTVDGDRGHLRSYVQATHVLVSNPDLLMILWAVYDDEMVRTSEGWQIKYHKLERLINFRTVVAKEI